MAANSFTVEYQRDRHAQAQTHVALVCFYDAGPDGMRIHIIRPGQSDEAVAAASEGHRRQFPRAWAAFQAGGTPSAINLQRAREIKAMAPAEARDALGIHATARDYRFADPETSTAR